jgi:hypothetical protein
MPRYELSEGNSNKFWEIGGARVLLTKAGIKSVQGLAKKIITADMQEADQDGEDAYYYVAIAE